MPIDHEDVAPAVIVIIQKQNSPAQKAASLAKPGTKDAVRESSITGVEVKIRAVVSKVRLDQIETAVMVVVRNCHAHTSLSFTIFIKGSSRSEANILKG